MRTVTDWLLRDRDGVVAPVDRRAPLLAREALAGAVASIVTLAHCLSYSALIFSGVIASGLPAGLWSFMAATALGCLIVALWTTLPPVLAGPRNPAVAVMSVLAATITADALAAGADGTTAARHVLAAILIATALAGIAMWLIGAFRLGQAVRFIPYPVIAGFLAASGWLLLVGGLKVAAAASAHVAGLATLSADAWLRAGLAMAFAATVVGARRLGAGATLLPVLFVGSAAVIDLALAGTAGSGGWFLAAAGRIEPWSPASLLALGAIEARVILSSSVEILSVAGVAAIALLLDASSLEAQRRASADMDREFRVAGSATLAAAAVGGFAVALAPNSSRLVDEMGGRYRIAGVVGALGIGLVLFSGFNVAGLVPTPVLGGLLIYLGYGVLADALWNAPARSSAAELALSLTIAFVIVRFGYLAGVMLGLVGACVLFALHYARIDAVRRHVTRAEFASPVERGPEAAAVLRREGGRIHVFWLSGFVFFGSANGVYEMIRQHASAPSGSPRRWVILDLGAVAGIDSTAMLSFAKLCTWARGAGVTLLVAAAGPHLAAALARSGMAGALAIATFPTRGDALIWAETELLAETPASLAATEGAAFSQWLDRELGPGASAALFDRYLATRSLAAGDVLCRQGDPSSSIELVASGSLAIRFTDATGHAVEMRRMSGRTVVGEMGFFRGVPRGASVVATSEAVVHVLDRAAYERMAASEPALARALLEFVARALADRIEFANKEIAALV